MSCSRIWTFSGCVVAVMMACPLVTKAEENMEAAKPGTTVEQTIQTSSNVKSEKASPPK